MSNSVPGDGSVYCFRTAPLSEFAPQVTDRYGALKVLGSNERCIVIAVLDSIWNKPPSLKEVRACSVLREHRFFHEGRPAVWAVNPEWWNLSDLDEMALLGMIPLSSEEVKLASRNLNQLPGSAISTMNYANHAAEGEWRWANDRIALVAEQKKRDEQQAATRAAQEERYRNRL